MVPASAGVLAARLSPQLDQDKEGAIPIISDFEGFMGYYVVCAGRHGGRDEHLQQLRGS
jgi:hypothetical protein